MPVWLSTLLAVTGSSSLVAVSVAAIMRALPYLAKARSDNAQTKLTRMQTRQADADARRAEAEARAAESAERRRNDEVTSTQMTAWIEEMKETIRQLQRRVEDAEDRAEKAERRALEAERRAQEIYDEYVAYRESIGRDGSITDRPPLPIPEESSSARLEVVHRRQGDSR